MMMEHYIPNPKLSIPTHTLNSSPPFFSLLLSSPQTAYSF